MRKSRHLVAKDHQSSKKANTIYNFKPLILNGMFYLYTYSSSFKQWIHANLGPNLTGQFDDYPMLSSQLGKLMWIGRARPAIVPSRGITRTVNSPEQLEKTLWPFKE